MNTIINKLLGFIKSEVVLCVSFLLAAASSFIIKPDSQYIKYIDWNTLLLLFALMAVMAGLQQLGLFSKIGNILLSKISTTRQMMLILIFLPFVLSMFITNDVALITFVPFAIMILKRCNNEKALIKVIVLMTIAANLGSMLTPIGNPQNLYLYGGMNEKLIDFILVMLPYTLLAFFALISWLKNPYNNNKSEVKVNNLSKKEIVFMFVLTAFVTIVFYYILKYFNTANLMPSTISVTTSFLAVYLTFRRSPYFALAYATNDIVLIVLWVFASINNISYISVVICFVVFFLTLYRFAVMIFIFQTTDWVKL